VDDPASRKSISTCPTPRSRDQQPQDPRPLARGDEGHPGLHERPLVIEARNETASGRRSPTWSWKCSPRPGRNTASTRSSTAFITYEEPDGKRLEIDSLFSTCIKAPRRRFVSASAPTTVPVGLVDNAGVIRFNDDWNLVFKVETHNSPSALDPYGGALTASWASTATLRHGQGRALIFNTDVFCFADPFYDKPLLSGSCTRGAIYEGVREGSSTAATRAASPR